jgi:hypothetical protein
MDMSSEHIFEMLLVYYLTHQNSCQSKGSNYFLRMLINAGYRAGSLATTDGLKG